MFLLMVDSEEMNGTGYLAHLFRLVRIWLWGIEQSLSAGDIVDEVQLKRGKDNK